MEEEVNYATVVFKAKDKPQDLEIIYDEAKAGEQESDTKPVLPVENKQKARVSTALHLVAAGLGIICVILVSVIVLLTIHFNGVISEQSRQNTNLTEKNHQLWTEKTDLQRQTEELSREKDGLNWTIGFIMEHEIFPVKAFCPKKVCKPCKDGWLLFQSKCYLFHEPYYWKNWEESRKECKGMNADLVVIESQEEQHFINNHTKEGSYADNGYWIGLSNKDVTNTWMWVNGSNLTVTYWKTEEAGNRGSCTQILARAAPLANWQKTRCNQNKRWICETRVLIKESAALS
ncbi:CD209 antigen-like protein C DC-SIGN-related protein 2 [Larimichthys crocea]|uniref:CD209 antigen-like protein C DC-SIGN-related protein 2 n=1 Tax=Larimichthys crocea TaxID=215358 RepID=A0A6G0ICP1_LARCR|nr:CD209 antigen-like protein C DC-SIGN-related protein 2 [Larimichthys crocea]